MRRGIVSWGGVTFGLLDYVDHPKYLGEITVAKVTTMVARLLDD